MKKVTLLSLALTLVVFQVWSQTSMSRKGHVYLKKGVKQHQLVVKFQPNLKAKADKGVISFYTPVSNEVNLIIDKYKLSFTPYFQISEKKLENIERKAKSGAQKRKATNYSHLGLGGIMKVLVDNPTNERLFKIAQALESLDEVLYCELESMNPPTSPYDISPTTPNYRANQNNYFGVNPGVDIDYAWTFGAKGKNVKVADVEYAWTDDHEEWNDRNFKRFNTIHPSCSFLYDGHGAAVTGMIFAGDNGYGVTGMSHEIDAFYAFPSWTIEYDGNNNAQAMLDAMSQLDKGDILLLEFQVTGPLGTLVPGEYKQTNWDATRTLSDAGIIVVATGSNGDSNMDDPAYDTWRNRGHSGAIMVGAGSSNTNHDKLSYSTYGSRFDIQGWGENITTCGWGGWKIGNDFNQQYTNKFGGTSGAGPMIVGVIACIQSFSIDRLGKRLTSKEIRDLLVNTGIAQGSGGHIGPLPNTRAAIDKLLADNPLSIGFKDITNDNNTNGRMDPNETGDVNMNIFNNTATVSGNTTVTCTATGANNTYVTVNTKSVNLGVLASKSTNTTSFNITLSASIPLETEIELTFDVSDGINSTQLVYVLTVGLNSSIDYYVSKFNEHYSNQGSIGETIDLTLIADEFTLVGNLTEGVHYSVSNLPTGLTVVFTTTSATKSTLSLTGFADNHANTNDVSNLIISMLDAGLTSGDAAALTNTSQTLSIDFIDPYSIVYDDITNQSISTSGGYWEHLYLQNSYGDYGLFLYNNTNFQLETYGLPIISIGSTKNISPLAENEVIDASRNWQSPGAYPDLMNITNASYTDWNGQTAYLGFKTKRMGFYYYGWMQLTVSADGKMVTLLDYAYNEEPYASIKTGQKTTIVNPNLVYSPEIFKESILDDGSIANPLEIRLFNETFTVSSGYLAENTHYNISNVPTGFTAIISMTGSASASITLAGNASMHQDTDDISDLTVEFLDAAFTGNDASLVNGSSTLLSVDFNLLSQVNMQEIDNNELFLIYPNPNSGRCWFTNNGDTGILRIINISGKVMYSRYMQKATYEISLEGLNKGIYVATFISEKHVWNKKLIIQ